MEMTKSTRFVSVFVLEEETGGARAKLMPSVSFSTTPLRNDWA